MDALYNGDMCHSIPIICNSKLKRCCTKTAIMAEQLTLGMWPTNSPSFITCTTSPSFITCESCVFPTLAVIYVATAVSTASLTLAVEGSIVPLPTCKVTEQDDALCISTYVRRYRHKASSCSVTLQCCCYACVSYRIGILIGTMFNPLSWKCHYSGFTPCHGETFYFGVECYNCNHFLMTLFSLTLPIFKVR